MPASLTTKLIRTITQKNTQADFSLFPSSFLYSFENSDLWLSLTLLPSSETTTQVRYDLFDSSSKANTIGDDVANAVKDVIKDLVQTIETEYQSMRDQPVGNSPNTRRILQAIQEHSKLEKMRGGLILPAMHQPKGSSLFQQAEQCECPFRVMLRWILTRR